MPGRRNLALTRTEGRRREGFRRAFGGIALACAATLVMLTWSCAAGPRGRDSAVVQHIGTYVWQMDEPDFGGFSGLHLDATGTRFTALSDRASLRWGRIERDDHGRITAIRPEGHARLKDSEGRNLRPGWRGDSEGLAIGADGRIWISFEGLTRVVSHDRPDAPAKVLPRPDAFKEMQRNSSLETLAILPDGTLLTMPERSGALNRPFPVWRYRNGAWDQPFSIPRRGDFLAVDAEVGPDGRFYLLERDFMGLLGFRSRVRRFDLGASGFTNEETLLVTRPLQYDNLEGISVWDDGHGIVLTMISDDNFSRLQRTEFVEYRVTATRDQGARPAGGMISARQEN